MKNMNEKLMLCLMRTEGNEEKLKDIPHRFFGDMAMFYRFVINEDEKTLQTVMITNEMLTLMDIGAYELHDLTLRYAPKNNPYKLRRLIEAVAEIAGVPVEAMPGERDIYIATTRIGMFGAGCLFYPAFLKETAELIEGSFYVVPSSIHEVILIPDRLGKIVVMMKEMIRYINNTEVKPEERLSYCIYHYDSDTGELAMAEEEE